MDEEVLKLTFYRDKLLTIDSRIPPTMIPDLLRCIAESLETGDSTIINVPLN